MVTPFLLCYDGSNKGREIMAGFCIAFYLFLFMGVYLTWTALFILLPICLIYNSIVFLISLFGYFYLKKKKFFEKYTEGWKSILTKLLRIFLIVESLICGIMAVLCLIFYLMVRLG